jgi:hypothetical protein
MEQWRELCQKAFDGDQNASALVTIVETGCLYKDQHVEISTNDQSLSHGLEQLGFTLTEDQMYKLPRDQQQDYARAKREVRQLWHQRQQEKLDTEIDQLLLKTSEPLTLSEQDRRSMVDQYRVKYGQNLQGFIRTLAAFLHFQRNHHYVAVWDMPRSRLVTIEQAQILTEVLGFRYVSEDVQPIDTHSVITVDAIEKAIRFEISPQMTDKEIARLAGVLKASHLDSVEVNEFWLSNKLREEGTVSRDTSCFAWLRNIIASIFNAIPHLFH